MTFKSFLEELFEVEVNPVRYKIGLFSLIFGSILGLVLGTVLMYSKLTNGGCNANPSSMSLFISGFAFLFMSFMSCFIFTWIAFGTVSFIAYTANYLKDLRDPVLKERRSIYRKRYVEEYGPANERVLKWLKTNYLTICKVIGGVLALIGLSYSLAYLLWLIFC